MLWWYQELLETTDVPQRCGDAFEGRCAIGNGLHECVCRCEGGFCDGFVLEDNGLAEPVAVSCFDVALMSVVVLWRGAQVPSVHGMEGPSALRVSLFVYLHLAVHGCQRHFVVVERPIQVCIGRHCGCGVGLAK